MNTPRTKQPKRYTGKRKEKSKSEPYGVYIYALENPEFAKVLGEIVSYWSHIEEEMIDILESLLGGSEDNNNVPARQIFRSIISEQARIKVMRSLLEFAEINHDKPKDYDEIIDEFAKLNKIRNTYVHGLWYTHESNRVFLRETTAEEHFFTERREVKIKELKTVVTRMENLYERIVDIIHGPFDEPDPSPETSLPSPAAKTP